MSTSLFCSPQRIEQRTCQYPQIGYIESDLGLLRRGMKAAPRSRMQSATGINRWLMVVSMLAACTSATSSRRSAETSDCCQCTDDTGTNDGSGVYCDVPEVPPTPPFRRFDNVPEGPLDSPGPVKTKAEYIRQLGALTAPMLSCHRRIALSRASIGGDYVVVTLSPQDAGYLVGSFGADPCVGVIVLGPTATDQSRSVYSFHFTATDNPYKTLVNAGLPAGSRIAVFGGNNTAPSNRTLAYVAKFIQENKDAGLRLTVDGESDTIGLWVDKDGNYERYVGDVASTNR
jgi:hypothetical protein